MSAGSLYEQAQRMGGQEAPASAAVGKPASSTLRDPRAIGEIRVVLAIAILVAAAFIARPTATPLAAYGVIGSYIAFALILYAVALMRPNTVRLGLVHWLDLGWLLLVISQLPPGSPVFLLLLFPVLVASAQAAFLRGVAVAVVAALAIIVGQVLLADGHVVEPETALRAGVLVALGLMIVRWTGGEVLFKRKLDALHRLVAPRRLRDDADAFWADTLETLAECTGAQSAFFVGHGDGGNRFLHEYEVGKPARSTGVDDEATAALAALPPNWVVSWRALFSGARWGRLQVMDAATGAPLHGHGQRLQGLAQTLGSTRWISFPVHTPSRYRGRVFLLDIDASIGGPDWEFVGQLARHVGLRLDNFLLAGKLSRVAASGERERISRDLHDGTVQPYLGLRYGLEALRRRIEDAHPLAGDIDELIGMTDASIARLRGYIHDLREAESDVPRATTALQVQVHQFEEYAGLKVDTSIEDFALEAPRLLEVRNVVSEGLSNIRRHTLAKRAVLEIAVDQDVLRIAFINPVTRAASPFKPRSLTERVAAMGGSVDVLCLATQTIVRVSLPLWTKGKP